jgi:hypothetical protein
MNTLLKTLLSAGVAAALTGCLHGTPSEERPEKDEINNSDPEKEDYRPGVVIDKKDVYMGPVTPGVPPLDKEIADQLALQKTAIDEGYVGVIPNQAAGYNSCPEANRVMVYMDDEDGGSSSSATVNQSGWTLPWGLNDGNSDNTRMYFCKVNGGSLAPLQGGAENDYAVLRLGDACPAGSYDFTIHIDNEDHSNRNANSGNVYPMTKNNNDGSTRWPMCFFPAGTANAKPSLAAVTSQYFDGSTYTLSDYAVFARGTTNYFGQKGVVRVDEEDEWFTDRIHKFIWTNSAVTTDYQNRIKEIFYLPNATFMYFRWAKRP